MDNKPPIKGTWSRSKMIPNHIFGIVEVKVFKFRVLIDTEKQ